LKLSDIPEILWPDPETEKESPEYVALPGTPTLPMSTSFHGTGSMESDVRPADGGESFLARMRVNVAVLEMKQANKKYNDTRSLVAYLCIKGLRS
jgi:hypothetical protein